MSKRLGRGLANNPKYAQKSRFSDWIAQAKRDLQLCELALNNQLYAESITLAVEATEKSLKGVAWLFGQEHVSGLWHSPDKLVALLPDPLLIDELRQACDGMENLYRTTRYPDAHPAGHPGILFKKTEADDWHKRAKRVVGFCELVCAESTLCFDAIVRTFKNKMSSGSL